MTQSVGTSSIRNETLVMTYSSKEERDAEFAKVITHCFTLAMRRILDDMDDPKGLWRKADWIGEKHVKLYTRILANNLYDEFIQSPSPPPAQPKRSRKKPGV